MADPDKRAAFYTSPHPPRQAIEAGTVAQPPSDQPLTP
jgi:hypothetical protein